MHIQTKHNYSIKFKPTYPGGKGSVLALPDCCLAGSTDALEVEEDSLGFAASADTLFLALGWAQSVAPAGSSPADATGDAEAWLSEQLAASAVDWVSAVALVQSEDVGASTESTGASETEGLPASGAEEDDSPLTEKWEIRPFAYYNLLRCVFQITNFCSKQHRRNMFKSHLYAISIIFV